MTVGEPDDMRPDEGQARSPAGYDAPDFLTVVYQRVFQLLDWRWPRKITSGLKGLFLRCTPEFAEPFKLPSGGFPRREIDVAIILAAMFFCLGMTAALAALSKTWWPSAEPAVLHWASDR